MKKLALLVLLSLCLVSTVYGMENEPEGFGGINWGTNLNTLNDMQLVQEKGAIGLYLRLNDKASIEKEEPRRADYFFYKDRLAAVRIPFNGITSFNDLKLALTEEHGEAQYQNDLLPGSCTILTKSRARNSLHGRLLLYDQWVREDPKTPPSESLTITGLCKGSQKPCKD